MLTVRRSVSRQEAQGVYPTPHGKSLLSPISQQVEYKEVHVHIFTIQN